MLAVLATATLIAATGEGAVRAVWARPPGLAAELTRAAVLLAVGMAGASGLGLLVNRHHLGEWLHLIYAVLAFGLVPIADNAAAPLRSNRGKALARIGGGLVSLVVLARLVQTG